MPAPAEIPARLLALLRATCDPNLAAGDLTLLKQGNYGNANVYRHGTGAARQVIKEFYSRPWFIRHTLGRFLIRREARALTDLAGIAGIPPRGRLLGPAALAMALVEGDTLDDLRHDLRQPLPKEFFLELERLVGDMHRAGYAHLDLRNLGNIICTRDGHPFLLDFQSCIRTARLPRKVREIMENTDRSGIYKCWRRLCLEPMGPERVAFMERFQRTRKLWIFKGYWFQKTWRKLSRHKPDAPPPGPA